MASTGDLRPLFGKDALRRLGISRRAAAEKAGISDTRWGQIVAGYVLRGGHEIPDAGPPGTVAGMALAIGVTPTQLRQAGRPDAADALEAMSTADERVTLRDASDAQIAAELARRAAIRSA